MSTFINDSENSAAESQNSDTFLIGDASIETLLSISESHLISIEHFIKYLEELKERKLNSDDSFVKLMTMKEIRRLNAQELMSAHETLQITKANYEPFRQNIEDITIRIEGKKKEIENRLKSTKKKNNASGASEAIETARRTLIDLETELEHATSTCLEYHTYLAAVTADTDLKQRLGLIQLKTQVAAENKVIGSNCATRGNRLENIMSTSLLPLFVSNLAKRYDVDPSEIAMLTNVGGKGHSIGFAASEFDGWVVQWHMRNDGVRLVLRVLAVIEAKNNPNDIGRSFVHFQESLAFLSNTYDDFDQAKWKTHQFPKGDFRRPCKPVLHLEGETWYEVAPDAFEHFKKLDIGHADFIDPQSPFNNTSLYIDNIYFVTRRKWLNGFHSSKSSLFAKKLASNTDFDLPGAYDSLFTEEVEERRGTLSTAQVLRLFQRHLSNRQCQLVLVKTR